ncbi:MAG TPA: sigma factor-like helix-turn-helix DNA-binding protein, partial [Thermoleophilia bacterium]|nr:sigma factor-like helix-turn-helix DNA-binding protein [Thermoleophilia bacterium]
GCRFFFNLSVREVAQAMGKTEGAVKALQFRALQRLRRRLAPDWSRT